MMKTIQIARAQQTARNEMFWSGEREFGNIQIEIKYFQLKHSNFLTNILDMSNDLDNLG